MRIGRVQYALALMRVAPTMRRTVLRIRSLVIVTLILMQGAAAAPRVHGGCFGRLSNQVPCDSPAAAPLAPFRKPHQPRTIGTPVGAPVRGSGTAQVEVQAFERLSKDTGEWSGIVRGNGEIRLALQILEHGRVTSTRWIGSVNLANQPTTFHFRSAIPTAAEWTWRVIAAPVVTIPDSRTPKSN